jgi:diguanylate cyclase
MIIETAIALSAASAGAAAGWYLHSAQEVGPADDATDSHLSSESLQQEARNNRQAAKDLLTQVHGLTTKVANQVDEHNLRVQAISSQLTAGDPTDLKAITDAIQRLAEANAWMQQQLDSAHSKLESQARLIESHVNEARTDALTGIANRRAFDEEMQCCLTAVRLEREPSCVMMIDVDHFKKFNDTHGHKAGDEVLRYVAQALKQAAGATGIVCRYGGEEFAVIFPKLRAVDVLPIAERCRAAIGSQNINYDGKSLAVHASAGLSEFAPRDTLETVLERADEALYASKRAGRNCGHRHDGQAFLPFVASPANPSQSKANPESGIPLDAATGLSTREALKGDLQRRLAELQREMQPLSLMICQIDNLGEWLSKDGDIGQGLALRTASLALRGALREMDHAARFENDSFAVVLNGANLETSVEVAQRVRTSLASARPKLAGQTKPLTLSIGVSEACSGDDVAKLFMRTQGAQLNSAGYGGNRISLHDGDRVRSVEEVAAVV